MAKKTGQRNSNGHRNNPTRKKGGKRHPELSYHGAPGRSILWLSTHEVLKLLKLV